MWINIQRIGWKTTWIFKSWAIFSGSFYSELWLDHSNTWTHSYLNLYVTLLEEGNSTPASILLLLPVSDFRQLHPSPRQLLRSFPVPAEQKLCHIMIVPPLCFTVLRRILVVSLTWLVAIKLSFLIPLLSAVFFYWLNDFPSQYVCGVRVKGAE